MTESRWQSAPPLAYSIRTELLSWTRAKRNAVYGFVSRQMTPELRTWIEARMERYHQLFPEEKRLRLWHEAAADVVAWQRGMNATTALEWLEAWEAE